MSQSQNGILFNTLEQLLKGNDDEVDLDQIDPDWHETCQALLDAPLEKRIDVFQALDHLQKGELTRLMATYQPTEEPPEPEPEPEMPPLPPEVLLDPDLAAGAAPWLDRYIDFSRRWSPRSYEGYHEACGLWLLSTIAARRVAFDFGHWRYTNLYLIMAGQSTLYAKTGAARIALHTLRAAGLDWLLAPDRSSPQGLISYMAGKTPPNYDELSLERQERAQLRYAFAAQKGWFYEEFGTGIVAMTRSDGYMAEFRSLLRHFDDCPHQYEYVTRTRGSERVRHPYLTMLCNLTPKDLGPVAHRGAQTWGDGFLARFCFMTPPPGHYALKRYPRASWTLPADLIEPLQQWHRRLGRPSVSELQPEQEGSFLKGPTRLHLAVPVGITEYALDADVDDAVYAYNEALVATAVNLEEDDLLSSYGGLHEKALRVAALLASMAGSDSIHLNHWARAQQVAEHWRLSLHRLYRQVNAGTPSLEARLEDRILRKVKHLGNPSASELSAYIKDHSTAQIGQAAEAMVTVGLLEVSTKSWGRRIINRYRIPEPEDPNGRTP